MGRRSLAQPPPYRPLCISALAGELDPSPPLPLWLFGLLCILCPIAFAVVIYGVLFVGYVLGGR